MTGIIGTYTGYEIIIDNTITKPDLVQARTHKKNRINKKWRKRYGMKHEQDDTKMIFIDNKVFMSEACYRRLKVLDL